MQAGADVDTPQQNSATPLHSAISMGHNAVSVLARSHGLAHLAPGELRRAALKACRRNALSRCFVTCHSLTMPCGRP